jgi:hypothetical protein
MKAVRIMAGVEVGFAAVMRANPRVWKTVEHPLLLLPDGLCALSNLFRDSDNQLRQLHDSVYEVEI